MVRGYKDDGDRAVATYELALQIWPRHSRHNDVEKQAARRRKGARSEKLLRRREGDAVEAK